MDGVTVMVAGKSHPPDPLPTRADLVDVVGVVDALDGLGVLADGAVVATVVGDGPFPVDRLTKPSPEVADGDGAGVVTGVGSGVGDAG
ncbi:MAG: hypothetical protein ABIP21_13260 [Acidimicrobiia bacterium]